MTGKELFEIIARSGMTGTNWQWETVSDGTHGLYNFIASLQGPLTAEKLYERVRAEGLLANGEMPWQMRSSRFRNAYIRLADVIK